MKYCGRWCLVIVLSLLPVLSLSCSKKSQSITGTETDSLKASYLKHFNTLDNIGRDTLLLNNKLESAVEANDTVTQLIVLNRLSDIYKTQNQFSNAIKSELAFQQMAQHAGSIYLTSVSMNRQADIYMSLNLLDEASRLYYNVLKDCRDHNQNDSLAVAQKAVAYSGVGTIFLLLNVHNKAKDYLNKSAELLQGKSDKLLLFDILLMKGRLMQNQEQYDSARQYINEALKLSLASNSRSALAKAFLSFGVLEFRQNNFAEAEINLTNAYNTLKNTTDKVNLIKICNSLGDTFVGQERFADAEHIYLEGLELSHELGHSYYLERLNYKLSRLFKMQNKNKLATHHDEQAYRYARQLNRDKIQTNLFNSQMDYEEVVRTQEINRLNEKYTSISNIQSIIIVTASVIIVLLIIVFIIHYRYIAIKRERNFSMIQNAKLKSEFYKQLSDEFRTPLTIISGLADKLKDSMPAGYSPHIMIDLELIEKQSKKLVRLVNEVLTVSNLKSDDNIDWMHGNIVHFTQFLYSGFIELAESKSINYLFHSSSDDISMDFSKENVRLVINNLINYMLRQCTKSDQVMVLVREDVANKKCYIEISGKSEMISQKEIVETIDLFYQREIEGVSRQKVNEFVAFSKYLVKNMEGTLTLRTVSPSSTTFVIELPVRHEYRHKTQAVLRGLESADDAFDMSDDTQAIESSSNGINKPNILVVEDNSYMIFYISSILKDKYNVLKAEDGKEALDIALEKMPSLIITDWMLPQIDGITLSVMLKDNFATSHIPIIMITAKVTADDKISAIKSGIDTVMQKPFNEEELLALIDNLLANRDSLRQKYSRIGADIMQEEKQEGSYNENVVFLQKITDTIYREIQNNDFFPEGLADEMNISSTHLNRKIKAVTGMNTMSYVNNIKLNRAKKLLITTSRSIGDIAMESGFADFSYFSRSFKKEFGVTPSQFQRMAIKEN